MISELIERGVIIPAPQAIVLEDIKPSRIMSGAKLYPGTILRGPNLFIGRDAIIGEGGGALIENSQIGARSRLMQGVYRDCTILDDVIIRNGAEIREGCLLEEGVELGHTVGLKQTIFMPNVVAGSLINFCDALMCGGTSRKNHSEIGSCMALYNFTPQGDKFASIFGDVEHGVFLNCKPIFIGGQTQIVSPVHIGFGAVLAAGSKLTQSIGENRIVSSMGHECDHEYDPNIISRPIEKVRLCKYYIKQLKLLKHWYRNVRIPIFRDTEYELLMRWGQNRIESGIKERENRLSAFVEKISKYLAIARTSCDTTTINHLKKAIQIYKRRDPVKIPETWECENIRDAVQLQMDKNHLDYISAIQRYASLFDN